MKKKVFGLSILLVTIFLIPEYLNAQESAIFRQEGIASWYGREYEGRPTASGEIFNSSQLTAAHPSLPFGTMIIVTNQHNNRKVTVRINDRGPFVPARIIDISRAAAEQLDMISTGTAPVSVESVSRIVISAPVTEQVSNTPLININPVNTTQSNVIAEIKQHEVASLYTLPSIVEQTPNQIKLIPEINIIPNKTYRLQIGSFKNARNAVDAFEKTKNTGLNPAYERYVDGQSGEFFRVVLAGVRGSDVQLTAEKLRSAGFREALIREEN
jgi:rare lipoprotein A